MNVSTLSNRVAELKELTRGFREARAGAHAQAAAVALQTSLDVRQAARNEGLGELDAGLPEVRELVRTCETTHKWHTGRHDGVLDMFERREACGTKTREVLCDGCGHVHKRIPNRCDVALFCERCGFRNTTRRRARFGIARGHRLLEARELGLFWEKRRGGRFMDKMLTLTGPHFDGAEYLTRYYGLLEDVRGFDMDVFLDVRNEARRVVARWTRQQGEDFAGRKKVRKRVSEDEHASALATLEHCAGELHEHKAQKAALKRMRGVLERWQQDTNGPAAGEGEVSLRIATIYGAWPLFLRALRKVWNWQATPRGERKWPQLPNGYDGGDGANDNGKVRKDGLLRIAHCPDAPRSTLTRLFEWTKGSTRAQTRGDIGGHPHFHVWLFAPWLPLTWLQHEWSAALRAVGVPLAKGKLARMDLRTFKDFGVNEIRELMKDGTKGAIKLARFEDADGPPKNAYEYAEGWSLAELLADPSFPVASAAHLMVATRGRRKTQASRGFFRDVKKESSCDHCGAVGKRTARVLDKPFFDSDDPLRDAGAFREWLATVLEARAPP